MASPLDVANAALLAAVTAGDVEAASAAVGEGADLKCLEEHSQRIIPLLFKAWQGNAAVAALLLAHGGADAKAEGTDGVHPLHFAAEFGQSSLATLLLECNANCNAKESVDGWTPLHYAGQEGHTTFVALLLERGADVNARDNDGRTPLFPAAQENHVPLVTLLLERGADINAKDNEGITALFLAADSGHVPLVALLLERGAYINTKDNAGCTSLFLAAQNGHASVVALLLERGDQINATDDNGWTPLFLAAQNGHASVVALLLERGAEINSKDNLGWTPLFPAAQNGHASVVALLLKHGADVNDKDINGWTPLSIAAGNGHVCVVALLLGCNAEDSSVSSSLHLAARYGRAAVVKLLLGWVDADVDAMDTHRFTPLHYIVTAALDDDPPSLENQLDCVLLLLQLGATITPQMTGPELLKLATDAVAHRRRDLVFTLLWRGVRVEAPEGDEAVDGASDLADKLAVETMLTEWPRGGLRAWRLEWHAVFPSTFRVDVRSLLLATLGSLDVGAEDRAGEADSMPRAARRTARPPQNPLRLLHEHRLLEPVFQPLLLAHMCGSARPPLANASRAD